MRPEVLLGALPMALAPLALRGATVPNAVTLIGSGGTNYVLSDTALSGQGTDRVTGDFEKASLSAPIRFCKTPTARLASRTCTVLA